MVAPFPRFQRSFCRRWLQWRGDRLRLHWTHLSSPVDDSARSVPFFSLRRSFRSIGSPRRKDDGARASFCTISRFFSTVAAHACPDRHGVPPLRSWGQSIADLTFLPTNDLVHRRIRGPRRCFSTFPFLVALVLIDEAWRSREKGHFSGWRLAPWRHSHNLQGFLNISQRCCLCKINLPFVVSFEGLDCFSLEVIGSDSSSWRCLVTACFR